MFQVPRCWKIKISIIVTEFFPSGCSCITNTPSDQNQQRSHTHTFFLRASEILKSNDVHTKNSYLISIHNDVAQCIPFTIKQNTHKDDIYLPKWHCHIVLVMFSVWITFSILKGTKCWKVMCSHSHIHEISTS